MWSQVLRCAGDNECACNIEGINKRVKKLICVGKKGTFMVGENQTRAHGGTDCQAMVYLNTDSDTQTVCTHAVANEVNA